MGEGGTRWAGLQGSLPSQNQKSSALHGFTHWALNKSSLDQRTLNLKIVAHGQHAGVQGCEQLARPTPVPKSGHLPCFRMTGPLVCSHLVSYVSNRVFCCLCLGLCLSSFLSTFPWLLPIPGEAAQFAIAKSSWGTVLLLSMKSVTGLTHEPAFLTSTPRFWAIYWGITGTLSCHSTSACPLPLWVLPTPTWASRSCTLSLGFSPSPV